MKHNRTTLRNGAAMAEFVDFHHVPDHQREIDARLVNWARWCCGSSGGYASSCHPMFRGYRDGYWQPAVSGGAPVDVADAVMVQKTLAHLPEKNRCAVQWCYVVRNAPAQCARDLAVSRPGLLQLIIDGRDMLKNRLPLANRKASVHIIAPT